MLSIAIQNLATLYIVAGLVSESCPEIENCSMRHGFRCKNGEMRLVEIFLYKYILCEVTSIVSLDRESSCIGLHDSLREGMTCQNKHPPVVRLFKVS